VSPPGGETRRLLLAPSARARRPSALAALSIATGSQYRPRSATNDLKEIVEDSMEELFRVWDERFRERFGALPARVRTLLERFTRCGDLRPTSWVPRVSFG